MNFKKAAASLLALTLFLLSACQSSGTDFREIEKLELIRTIGIDAYEDQITVSAATGMRQSSPPTVLCNKAHTVGLALRQMQTFSEKDIYFAHVSNCIIGEEVARQGLTMYLDYIERELSVRYTTGLFVVRDDTAESVIRKVSDEEGYVTERLESIKKDVRLLSEGHVYSVGEVAQNMLEKGCALVAAVRLNENEGIISGAGKINVEPAGYALINGDRLEGFIDVEQARGVNILTNKAQSDVVEVEDGKGGICALSVVGGKTEYSTDYADGVPQEINIKIKLTANIEELHDMVNVYDEGELDGIKQGLKEREEKRVLQVIEIVKELGLDFIGIGDALEMKNPVKFAKIKNKWPELLKEMEFNITWEIVIARTYDIGEPIGYNDRDGGIE